MNATTTPDRPFPVSDRIGEHPPKVRDTAIGWLRGKIAAGEAGLDPFDAGIFILVAHRDEIVWAYRMLEQAGQVLTITDLSDLGRRYAAVIDDRAELGLHTADAPVMDTGGCSFEDAANVAVDHVLEVLPQTLELLPRPGLALVEPDDARSVS